MTGPHPTSSIDPATLCSDHKCGACAERSVIIEQIAYTKTQVERITNEWQDRGLIV